MKIVVLNDSFLNEDHLDRLRKLGDLELALGTKTEEQVIDRLKDADVAIADIWEAPLNKHVFANIPSVKFMSINSTGFDVMDVQAAKDNGVIVSNVPGFGTQAVAEHTIALLLAVAHHVVDSDKALRQGPFQIDPANRDHDRFKGVNIGGKTLGIIGLGQIGTRVAELAQALGMNVIGYNRTPRNIANVEMVSLEEVLKRSDVVSLNGAVTPDQENIINTDSLKLMKPGAILINTARGGFIDDQALANAVISGQLAGAGLDFLHEWSADNPLIKLDNVVLNPHIAWFTEEALANLADIVTANVESFVSGNPQNIIT